MNRKAWKLYVDGSSLGNPGPGGCGFVLISSDGDVTKEGSYYLGIVTNNEAEYQSLIIGLTEALSFGAEEIEIITDSQLLFKQLLGEYKVKAKNLKPLYKRAKDLLKRVKWKIHWVEREENKRADFLARRAAKGGEKGGKIHS